MFSGIVEALQPILSIEEKGTNLIFTVQESFDEPLYIDQSISHNGVCLTVIEINDNNYKVEAIKETLDRSNLGHLKIKDLVNLERSVRMNTRMDGHMVQGHVDNTAKTVNIKDENGSWIFSFELPTGTSSLVIPKGSITINGISLTVMDIQNDIVSVAIIPYTYEHTNLRNLTVGDLVNIEFDAIGKYVINYLEKTSASSQQR